MTPSAPSQHAVTDFSPATLPAHADPVGVSSVTDEILSIWTIYRHPRDFPEHFVVRAHVISKLGTFPRPVGCLCESLDEARRTLPPGLTCLHRHEYDDPVIAESWL